VLVVGWAIARWSAPTLVVGLVRAACILVFVDAVLELGQLALHGWQLHTAGAILAAASWQPVEAVVVRGAPADRSATASVILDPDTGRAVHSFLVEAGAPGWPPSTGRSWYLLAIGPDGDRAVLAEPDRSELAVVRARGGFLRAEQIHRWARRQAEGAPA
jgi:hypothetical protein